MSDSGEFDFIANMLAPLSKGYPGSFNLTDDAASLAPEAGHEFVVTSDMLVESRHFLPSDPLDLVARKALRVNLSDLAVMGAKARYYMLSIAWPQSMTDADRALFVEGLKADQAEFGITLIGGDTTSTDGPLTISITAFGEVPAGKALLRSGARSGDMLVVTGEIGEGFLGLKAARGEWDDPTCLQHYQCPSPRLDIGLIARDHAHAGIDISDGLLADATHLAESSELTVSITLDHVPLSAAAKRWLTVRSHETAALLELVSGGDDYELLLAVSPDQLETLDSQIKHNISVIGRFSEGRGLSVVHHGQPVSVTHTGFTHF